VIRIISTPAIDRDAQILWVLTAAMILQGLFSLMNTVLSSFDRTKRVGGLWTVVAVSNLALNLVLVPLYGIAGAALATLIGFVIGAVGMYFISPVSVDIPFPKIAKMVLSSLVMGLVVWTALNALSTPVGIEETVGLILLGVFTYFAGAVAMGLVGRNEVSLVMSAFEE
jgi:O-antigen/teichoic acid export membrane protein